MQEYFSVLQRLHGERLLIATGTMQSMHCSDFRTRRSDLHEINFFYQHSMNIAEEDYDLDMPDGSGTSSRLVFKLLHPRIVKCYHALASSSVIVITSTSKIIYSIAINNFLDQNCFHSASSFNKSLVT